LLKIEEKFGLNAINEHQQRVEAVAALLVGKNCGACGFASCAENAEAIVRGTSGYDSCVASDPQAREKIKALLNLEPKVSGWALLWRWLTSVRLAIGLILALTVISVVGTLIPQNAQPLSYIDKFGAQGYQWIQFLQLDRLFQSWYFLAFLFALLVNTLCCTIKRSRVSYRLLARPMPDRSALEIARMDQHLSVSLGAPPTSDVLKRVKGFLEHFHYHVVQSDARLKAHKRRFGRLGVDVLHISLVVVLAGAAAGSFTSFEGFQAAHQGETFEVPQGGFSVRVDNLWSESYANQSRVKDWFTTLTVLDDGREALTRTIQVNQPLTYKGVSLYQASFGSDWWDRGKYTVQVIRNEDGKDLGTYEVDSNASVYVPLAQFELSYVTFFSDFAVDENLQSYNRSKALNNPALYLRLQGADGTDKYVWAFAQNEMRTLYQTHLATAQAYQFNLVGMAADQFTGLQIARNPALPVIYAGFLLMGVGLFLNFYWPPHWVWVTVDEHTLQLGANAKDSQAFELGLRALVNELACRDKNVDVQPDVQEEVIYVR